MGESFYPGDNALFVSAASPNYLAQLGLKVVSITYWQVKRDPGPISPFHSKEGNAQQVLTLPTLPKSELQSSKTLLFAEEINLIHRKPLGVGTSANQQPFFISSPLHKGRLGGQL